MRLLPELLAFLTGRQRYRPEIEWSSKSWTHNAFRLYELVFWRRVGIRAEISAVGWQDDEGNNHVAYAAHSVEAIFALTETYIRNLLASWKPQPFRICVPILRMPTGFPVFASPYLFAIAFDASDATATTTSTSITYAHTVTGSNPFLVSSFGQFSSDYVDRVTGVTYAAVAMTREAIVNPGASVNPAYLYSKTGPATGANNIVITSSLSKEYRYNSISFSGTAQTGQPDSSGTNSIRGTALAVTVSSTVVANGCWLVSFCTANNDFDGALGVTGDVTARQNTNYAVLADSNGTVSTGSRSSTFTSVGPASDHLGAIQISIAPVVVVSARFRTLMGVGQ